MAALGVLLLVLVALWALPGRSRRVGRWLTLFILCVVLVPALLLVDSLAWACRLTILDAGFHRRAFHEAGMADGVIRALALHGPVALTDKIQLPAAQKEEARKLLEACMAEAVTPTWVEEQVGGLVAGLLAYLKGEQFTLALEVDLGRPKADALRILGAAKGPPRVLAGLRETVAGLPDRVSPATLPFLSELQSFLGGVREKVRPAILAAPAGVALAVVLLLLARLACGRGGGMWGWLAASLLLGGAGSVTLTVAGGYFLPQMAGGLNLSPQLGEMLPLREWVGAVARGFLHTWQLLGAGLAGAGVLAGVVPRLWRPRWRSAKAAQETAGESGAP